MFAFREIQKEDDPFIAHLVRSNLEQAGLDIPGTAYFDVALDHLSSVYGQLDSRYFVLTDDTGRVVGGVGYARFDSMEDTAELQKLYLDDTVKGEGVGYQMIAFIEDRMREAGYRWSYLETHDALQAAMHIYEKTGYHEIDRPSTVGHSTMNHFYLKRI